MENEIASESMSASDQTAPSQTNAEPGIFENGI
jgi:hypothetical protein